VRDDSVKTIGQQDIIDTVRAIEDAGINIISNFIFGLPSDTEETMRETLDLAKTLNCAFANFYACMAYPGSGLYKTTPESDLPKTWSGYSQHSFDCCPLPTEALNAAQVLEFRDKAFTEYYSGDDYLNMIEERFGWEARRHITSMAEHRLKRMLLGSEHINSPV
jgi:anaerobic magnesium-protoporphyrin IX monomethyl ester cyclase